MGLFDRFGKSFEEEVQEAIEQLRAQQLGVDQLAATVAGKVVTLSGVTTSKDAKLKVMQRFGELVKADNVLNTIRIVAPAAAAPAPAAAADAPTLRIHEVVAGETLGVIAKRYYGKAGLYPKIFEANRDILDNPDLIKVGQKLRIPD